MLETKRMILRKPAPQDAEAYLKVCNSAFVLKYNAMTPKTYDSVRQEFENVQDENTFIMQHKESGAVIGAVFVQEDSLRWGVESRELSYFLDEAYSKKGYMKEALSAVITYLFETQQLTCVAARSFAPNTASRKLLESLGFCQDGLIPSCVKGYGDIIYDDALYSVFREKWK